MSINNQSVLAIIPARGGSKELPGKNIKSLAGKPLIAWTIEAAQQSQYIDRLILSSDDEEIIATAREYGCEAPFVRPAALATDDATSIDVVFHALDNLPAHDIVILLQPTSPLRDHKDIDTALELMIHKHAESCVSVCQPEKSPYWMYHMDNQGKLVQLLNTEQNASQRQQLPPVYALNGAIYISTIERLRKHYRFVDSETVAYPMNKTHSIDIDDALDFQIASLIVKEKHSNYI